MTPSLLFWLHLGWFALAGVVVYVLFMGMQATRVAIRSYSLRRMTADLRRWNGAATALRSKSSLGTGLRNRLAGTPTFTRML